MFKKKPNAAPLLDAEKLNWLRLYRTENVGPITFYKLLERFGSAQNALDALPELAQRGGRKKPLIAPSIAQIQREYESLIKIGAKIITAQCDTYPSLLRTCDDAPPILSYLGNINLTQQSCIAIVGARNASLNGRKIAQKISHDLGASNQVIVSGLARGIDTAAHNGALQSGTIAVVAGGIDAIYPQENTQLYHHIREQGLILAESPFGTAPQARHFPKRNRIVSGISRATIIVEATMRSGSIITANMAGDQGREVLAIPGSPMDPRAQGPNHLIREGATLIRNAQDVMEIMMQFTGNGMREPYHRPPNFIKPLTGAADSTNNTNNTNIDTTITQSMRQNIVDQLSFTPVSIDELLRACDMRIPVLQTILLELELAGRVKRLPGNRISLLEAE